MDKQQMILKAMMENALFHGFSRKVLLEMLPKLDAELCGYEKGNIAVREDTPVSRIAIVTAGQFYATKLGNEKSTPVMKIFHAKDVIGLPELISTPKTWARSCTCSENGTLLWLDINAVTEAVGSTEEMRLNLQLRDNLQRIVADNAVRMFYRIEVISTNPLRERILLFLRLQQEKQGRDWIKLKMNRGQFAEYLSVDRATLSRELSKLAKLGKLELSGDYCYKIKK